MNTLLEQSNCVSVGYIKRLDNGHVKRMQEERLPKLIMEWIPEERGKRTPKKNVDGRGTSSHGKKTFRNGPVVKQEGMVFGFRKTAAAVTKPER